MAYNIKPLEWEFHLNGKYLSWTAITSYHFYVIRKHDDVPEYYIEVEHITIGVKDTLATAMKVAEDHWNDFVKRGLIEC